VVLGLGGRRLSRVLDGVTRDYVWLGDTLVGYYDGTAAEPVRVITNHIGFPLMAIDPSGTTIWDPLHEPYGELIGTFSKTADPGLRYPGQWQDEVELEGSCVGDDCTMPGPLGGSVSLFENGFRWYRTAWGRYSQSDPLGQLLPLREPQKLFQYASGNPLRTTDEYGLWDQDRPCDRYRDFFGSWCCREERVLIDPYPFAAKKACEDFLELYDGNVHAYCVALCLPEKESQFQGIRDCKVRNTLRLNAHVSCYKLCAFVPINVPPVPPGALYVGVGMLLRDYVELVFGLKVGE
jgi:RHS repeat-associated protein